MPPVAVAEFTQVIDELSARVSVGVDRLLSRLDRLSVADAFAFVTDAYPALIEPYLKASGDVTAQWYAEQPAPAPAPGVGVFVPTAAPLPPATDLGKSARWALTTAAPAVALNGSATRQVFNASRDTVTTNARREGVRWVRQARPNACGFCKLFAVWSTDGLTFGDQVIADKRDVNGNLTGEKTVVIGRSRKRRKSGRKPGEEYHDHCRCTAIPLRDGGYTAPDYVYEWRAQYDRIVAGDAVQPGGIGVNDTALVAGYMDEGRVRSDRPDPVGRPNRQLAEG